MAETWPTLLVTWFDVPLLWSDHLAGTNDHTDAPRVLASLEINLKIRDIGDHGDQGNILAD